MHLRDGEVKWKMFHLFRSFGSEWTRWELREACFICEGLKYNDSRSTQIPVRSQQVSSHRESSKLRALSKAGGLYIAKDSLRPEKEGLRRGWAGLWGHRAEGCSGRAAGQQFGRSVQQQPAPPSPAPWPRAACSHCQGLALLAQPLARDPTWRNSHLWPSLTPCLSALVLLLPMVSQIGQRTFMFVLFESLPFFFFFLLSCFIPSMKLCFISLYLLLSFSFKCRVGWGGGSRQIMRTICL